MAIKHACACGHEITSEDKKKVEEEWTQGMAEEAYAGKDCPFDCGVAVKHRHPDGIAKSVEFYSGGTAEKIQWEKRFDEKYGSDLRSVAIGIVAGAMTHAQTNPIGTDASHIMKKLLKILAAEYKRGQQAQMEMEKKVHNFAAEEAYKKGFIDGQLIKFNQSNSNES